MNGYQPPGPPPAAWPAQQSPEPPPPLLPPHAIPPQATAKKTRSVRVVGAIAAVTVCVFAAGLGGVVVGANLASKPEPIAPPAAASSPTDEQVRAATVDLCTRFAAAYRAMPSPQESGFDVIPTATYVGEALAANTDADSAIRQAVERSLELLREHAALLSHEAQRGAIQPPNNWTAEEANAADQRVWDLCRAYDG